MTEKRQISLRIDYTIAFILSFVDRELWLIDHPITSKEVTSNGRFERFRSKGHRNLLRVPSLRFAKDFLIDFGSINDCQEILLLQN